ncbi:MAG: Ig-like domain-containing protein [Gammaproteobacteria bacterium]|nr:Ig-like domain-containing protein [Gammaproteobacteria bacterium]MDH5303786.1 Ig-like domain-containing protein [Gammaproteobacteria bacterium]
MRSRMMTAVLKTALFASVLLTAVTSSAADVYLEAKSFDKQIPDGAGGTLPVKMWGFAMCDSTGFTNCELATEMDAPGPQINVLVADALNIHLRNSLPNVPVSIMIPGQPGGGDPVPSTGRVGSFTHEAQPGGDATYTWLANTLNPGTYLYQSGSYPSLEVPMGLYGALVVNVAVGEAYPGVMPDAETLLLFSEIDPIQNQRVDNAAALAAPTPECVSLVDYADPASPAYMALGYPCSVDYSPALFLVNGQPSADSLPAGDDTGNEVLLRFLNAGLRSHSPSIVGAELALIAEDGNLYPLARQQNEAMLAAGKTIDALIATPAGDFTYSVFDRMPTFSNENLPNGGALGSLQVGAGAPPPPTLTPGAVDDFYTFNENSPLTGKNVLTNDIGLAGATAALSAAASCGTAIVNPDGTFSYTATGCSGLASFDYTATLGVDVYTATVTIDVSFLDDAPVARDDAYVNAIGATVTVAAPGILANDSDPDGDTLSVIIDGITPAGLVLDPLTGAFSYSGPSTSFSYFANDGTSSSDAATVEITVNPVAGIVLTVQDPDGTAVDEYRWVVQENRTYIIDPAAPPLPQDTLSTNFHKSSMPVVAQGSGADEFLEVALDPAKHYYVSILPSDAGSGAGHTLGGAEIRPGMDAVTVIVNEQPIPTAQISVLVFEDNLPTNGAPDPLEPRLGGWQITLEDAGGRYGISGGVMSQDAFGAPLKNSLLGLPSCPGAAPTGVILTCPDGTALIVDLPPGKFGVTAAAPASEVGQWTQTSTIEGSRVIDAWVKANEPPFFAEFGVASFHAFFGFVNPSHSVSPGGDNVITGRVTMQHPARPPIAALEDSNSYVGLSHTRAWVGLNSDAGSGANIAAVQADEDGYFTISNVPDGTHQLVVWDTYLDQIISFRTVILSDSEGADVGNIAVPTWFGRHEHTVFLDDGCAAAGGGGVANDAVRQDCEEPLPEQAVNLRWRDGTVFQSFPTDTTGFVPFDQIFPFGSWQVAEIDYTRFKATGVTITVDGGGDVTGGPYPGLVNPQVGSPRTETGAVLTAGFNSLAGMTSLFDWGKAPYAPGENGGISGIVFYGSTRGENDPRLTVGDPWEPGIASARVRLYHEVARPDGSTTLALVEEVETDSWDANPPTACPGENGAEFIAQSLAGDKTRCYDGVRNWEQVRPAVFDGGYAFNDIPAGKYVVEVVPPPGYELIKEEDVNVGFGDSFGFAPVAVVLPGGALLLAIPDAAMVAAALAPEPGLAQPPCVGTEREVGPYLSLFPSEMIEAPFAGALRPTCDRKEVILSDQGQAAADFHLFTSTPVAGQFQGLTTDDIAIETNPGSPSFGDKWGPAFMPISMRDFKGQEIYRTYSDAFGRYNGMLPSTFTANIPIPSGYSPAMHLVCLNDPMLANGGMDPFRNPNYGTFCYTLQYMPGTTTYLDTPLIPQSAFAAGFNSVDCACTDGTPKIASVRGSTGGSFGPLVAPGGSFVIRSVGQDVAVPNPAYEGPLAAPPYNQPTVTRDFDFGATNGTVTLDGIPLAIQGWNRNQITVTAPSTPMQGQLVVTRADNGKSSINAVTVTVGTETPIRVPAGGSIQAAIDAADPGALILVESGTYNELVVLWKPVRLQGSGSGTIINGLRLPSEKLDTWRQKVKGLIDSGEVDLLPGQPAGDFDLIGGGDNLIGGGLFGTELGAAITVLAKNDGSWNANEARIDGFTVTGADGGGGIFVNGYAHNLEVGNNHVTANMGNLSGGVRFGHPYLATTGSGPFDYNNNVRVHHNAITQNGARANLAVGGGVALNKGTNGYQVSDNYICGNFSIGDGAGVGQLGLSDGGTIARNQILFNQSFNTEVTRSGGGIMIAGEPSATGLTLGSGDIVVDANLIQGNQAGSGHGGGIRAQNVNGADTATSPWSLTIINNMIVNNLSGWSGAGISLQDTTNASIINNTVANNDSTATVGTLVAANSSSPQPAGISVERHSAALAAALGDPDGFSDPILLNNIVWHNRSFVYDATAGNAHLEPVLAASAVGECNPATTNYWDLGVLGEPVSGGLQLSPIDSILTNTAGYDGSNIDGDPDFLSEYCNGARTLGAPGPMQVAAEVIEGGNFIDVRFGPLTQSWPVGSSPWDYHIGELSAGLDNGNASAPGEDFDAETRPQGAGVDRGADEMYVPGTVTFTSATFGTLSGGTLAFGNITGNGTQPSTVTLTVAGNPVTFQSLTVTGSSQFSKGADTCSGQTVTNSTCTVTINLVYNGNGQKAGTLTVTDNGAGSPQTLALTGR